MFFTSWQLWEQMTFVLALSIVGVFVIGWGKLLWVNRLVQRQEIADEEKRTRIQRLRNSGQLVEAPKSHDIPFGVRAIQSGIEVDGIWISQTTTPVPSVLKLGHLRSRSKDNLASTDSSKDSDVSELRSDDSQAMSRYGKSAFRSIDLGDPFEAQEPACRGPRVSYKPRRSSHLRYGSHGVYDEETLGHLEGKRSPIGKARVQRPRGPRNGKKEIDSSSAADNERSSDNSSESDGTLTHKPRMRADPSRQALLGDISMSEGRSFSVSSVPSGKPVTAVPSQSAEAEYFSISVESPDYDKSDPFETPFVSPVDSPETSRLEQSPTFAGPRQLGNSQQTAVGIPSSSTFVPGELHVNKVVRKVNSGFLVLPAGTFGQPADFNPSRGMDEDHNNHPSSGERRHSTRLQKKPRTSMTGGRPPSTVYQP
ncbi:unnamed protein product [Diplocarpon coronariae]|uniref:Uncharacterized protein n=1 Tax=Diplocarpon coronariae TaxID=2795749 RepID=A0A218Z4N5_9HELO|nr:hypothetical protein JHW43_002220 [Diplocarpon mali]OWP02938.1 hypothetical protein B2J93_3518 [Marssonina coronariae]